MGNWYTKNESGKTLLVFEEPDISRDFDTVTLSMLINNDISSLVPCSFSQVDDTRYVKFNVTYKVEFVEFLERQTTFDVVSELFINMCRSFIELHKYMIDGEALFLDVDKMYIDISVPMTQFIINPVPSEQKEADFKRFFQNIVVQLKMSGSDSQYIGYILTLLNDKSFSLDGFVDGLEKLKSSAFGKSENPEKELVYSSAKYVSHENVHTPPQREERSYPTKNNNADGVFGVRNDTPSKPVVSPQPILQDNSAVESGGKISSLIMKFGKKSRSADKPVRSAKAKVSSPSMGNIAVPGQDSDLIAGIAKSEKANQPANYGQNESVPQRSQPDSPSPIEQTESGYGNSISKPKFDEYIPPVSRGEAEDDSTQMMGGYSDDGVPTLYRLKTCERIEIDKDSFNIGKDPKALNDYIINDGRISHRHASIIYKNGKHYIIDRGSTNHTFLNGKMLVPNNEYELNSGDGIKMGPEEFTFEI